ncbi:MAG: ABC transporter ATP-binding protein [Planctomycetota bacterium]|jgi:ABC-2 type transport system ATP-binding protein|nr:ABC transporter ATP-binding protein [Planctomycetaceae bacterium]
MSETVVETKNLTKRYGAFTALNDLSIHVDRGQILGFIGPNGAGKTTTIKILVGLSKPTSGSATIAGVDCSQNASKIKQLVGYMPDKFGSYDNMRVHEYLDFFGAIFGIPGKQRKARIQEVMETTNTTYMQDRYVESLSHGMQQRVGIARTLLHNPEVLILDEPANGLDPKARIEMRQLLLQLAAQGKTLIVTSHILPELSRICNVVAIVTAGQLRAFGSVDEVMGKLCPQRNFEVQLASAEHIPQAQKLLSDALLDSEPLTASPAELTLRFPTVRTESELAELLQKLVAAKLPITQFRELTSDLEDAFLSVAGKD